MNNKYIIIIIIIIASCHVFKGFIITLFKING